MCPYEDRGKSTVRKPFRNKGLVIVLRLQVGTKVFPLMWRDDLMRTWMTIDMLPVKAKVEYC